MSDSPSSSSEALSVPHDGPLRDPRDLLKRAELDFWDWDIQNDLIEVSDHQGTLFNFSAGHFRGSSRSFINRVYVDDRDPLIQKLRLASRGVEPGKIHFRMRTQDGTQKRLQLRTQLITDSHGLPERLIGVLHNVSQRETSEDRLHQQQAALLRLATADAVTQGHYTPGVRLIAETAARVTELERVAVWSLDSVHGCARIAELFAADGTTARPVELRRERFPQLFSYLDRDELIAADDARLDPRTAELIDDYLVPHGITSMMIAGLRRGGEIVGLISFEHTELPRQWRVDERGFASSIADMLVMLREICDRKQMEGALKTQQQLTQALLDHSASFIYMKDLEGRFLLVNRRFEQATGLSRTEILNKTHGELFSGKSGVQVRANDLEVLRRGETVQFEEQVAQADGEHLFQSVKFPIYDEQGQAVAIAGISTDMTQQKRRDNLVLEIAKALSAETGGKFFRLLTEHLAQVLEADFAFSAQLVPERPNRVSTLSAVADGHPMENFECELTNSPCEHVFDTDLCVIEQGVQQQYPDNQMLRKMGVQAYVGAALKDNRGNILGLLMVLYRQPISDTETARHLLQIFAVRAASELQRQINEAALIASEERYRAFINNSSEGIWRADLIPSVDTTLPPAQQADLILDHYLLLEANEAMARMYGYSLEEFYGCSPRDLYDEEQFRRLIIEWINAGYRLTEQESCQYGKDRNKIWCSSSYSGVIEQGRLVRIWGTRRDITERKRHLSAIEHQANHDTLTDLPNRFWLNERLGAALQRAEQERKPLALMLMDLDHFKEVNDSLGHQTGDQLLKQIGPRLDGILQQSGADLARLGGDEFALLAPRLDHPDQAVALAEQVYQALHAPFDLEGIKLEISCSIGIALYPNHGTESSSLLRCADVAMYLAKKTKSSHALYNPDLDQHSRRRLSLMSELGQAMREDQLVLHYQPKLELKARRRIGYEALVRWQHPVHGLIPPDQFVPLAEMGDMIHPLTHWVLDRALAQCRTWLDRGETQSVAVNLSTRNLMDERCPAMVQTLLKRHRVPPQRLELEITESALIADPDRALDTLREISDSGVVLSIDDFGTGYSSLAYLKRLPIHQLKIDMSFVRNMVRDKKDAMIVQSTIALAHNLGLRVVAEGIEDEATLDALEALECDLGQGYLIGRPAPIS